MWHKTGFEMSLYSASSPVLCCCCFTICILLLYSTFSVVFVLVTAYSFVDIVVTIWNVKNNQM